MAIQVKMLLTWIVVFFALNSCQFFVTGNENEEANQKIIENVLKHLNEENNTKYLYESAKIIEAHKHLEESYILLDVATTCQDASDDSCEPISLVCQGATDHDTISVVKCFLKEEFPELPNYGQGFIVKRSNTFIEEVLEHGLQKLERDGGPKRKIIETLSVKKRETSNTEVFVTAKVTAGSEEGGDLLELEICELSAVLGTPGSMQILDTETKCFPLLEDPHDTHIGGTTVTSDELSTLAYWALAKINHGTNLVFNYSLVEVIKADAVTTPGSGGLMTTLQVRLAPSKCPKYSAVSQVEWECNPSGQPLICTMSAWERPWRGDTLMSRPRCKRIPIHTTSAQRAFSGESVTQRPAFCTGCVEEVNKENPKVTELASAALEQLNAGQLAATPHQLLRVLSAHRQVVNGIRYILNVELAPCSAEMVPCEITADAEGGLLCRLELLESPTDLHRTLLSSLCQPRNQANEASESEAGTQTQQATSQLGEESSTLAPNAEVAETTLLDAEQADAPAKSSEENSSEEKVISEKTDKSSEEQDSSEEKGQKEQEQHVEYAGPHTTQRRTKRAAELLGSAKDVDMEKEGELIQQLAQMALKNIDDIDDDLSRRKLMGVVSAKKQVVNGMLYHLTIRVGIMPPCDDGGVSCMAGDLPSLLCKVQIHQAAADTSTGQKATRVLRSECEPEGSVEIQEAPERPDFTNSQPPSESPSRQKRTVVGGRQPANTSDPYVQEIVNYSLTELDRVSNALYKRHLVRVVSAEKQVVSGIMNHLTLELGYSSCRKGSSPNEICSLQSNLDREMCTLSVWDRPWLKERSVQNFTCTRLAKSARAKRDTSSLLGHGSHDIHIGLFRDYMAKHGKQYSNDQEMKKRFHIFRANMRKVKVLQETEQGTAKYGATKFADLTAQEFKQQYLGLNRDLNGKGKMRLKKAVIPDIQLPTDFDWRHYNVVTPVKNQGSCGSCWAFSVTGNVEGQWALRRGSLISLSEQELVDCDKLDEGCNGGLPSNAYEALQKLGGLEAEDDYPYEGRGESCQFNKSEVRATVTGGLNITTNETAIAQWLVKNGPISIGINANAMQFYFGGVSHPWKLLCDPADLDHGVLIVGFGVHTTSIRHKRMPYWIVKNSWGRSWGEQGYYRVYRGDGTCGVNQMATSAIVG